MVYNFSKVVVKDIDDKDMEFSDFSSQLANLVYQGTRTLEFLDMAKDIKAEKDIEMNDKQVGEFKLLITANSQMAAFVKKGILDYIETVKPDNKK